MRSMKFCPSCQTEQPLSNFTACRSRRDSLQVYCKDCLRAMQIRLYSSNDRRERYLRHKERELARWAEYKRANPGKVKDSSKKVRANRAGKQRAYNAQRKRHVLRATPIWVDHKAIRTIYEGAEYLTRLTGVRFDVDHVLPLRSKTVCGLHVAENLQYLTHEDNQRKRNHF